MNAAPAAPSPAPEITSSPVLSSLRQLHREIAPILEGAVATYIPELAKANPDHFAICLVTASGTVYEVGDSSVPFTIQSISKPFVYGLALEDNGRPAVLEKVGVEPTGDAFNSISLEAGTGRPRNPMINAGAIATAGLVAGKTPEIRLQRILAMMSAYAGRELSLDQSVYRSESETGHRNRAIGHLLRNFGILTSDPHPVVELYFQQCSVSVTARDLAVMAATLANRGINPLTQQRALRGEYVESVLSVMETCGMYDFAGQWVYQVGMPAKSGVSGGIIAVLPGHLGIAVYSPRLDSLGNSVRGIRVCQELSRHLDLHLLNCPTVGAGTLRRRLTAAEFSSNCVRNPADSRRLREAADALQLFQVQGHLTFTTMEMVVREVLAHEQRLRYAIFDLRRVLTINESACYLLHHLLLHLASRGTIAAFSGVGHLPLIRRYLRAKLGEAVSEHYRAFADTDRALEWAENRLLATDPQDALPSATYQALSGLTDEQLQVISRHLRRRTFKATETLVQLGEAADEMFLLAAGSVSVVIDIPDGPERRLATFSPGMNFGEMAMLDRAPRSARIVADTDGAVDVLTRAAFEQLEKEQPGIVLQVMRNLCLSLSSRLRKANAEIAVLV